MKGNPNKEKTKPVSVSVNFTIPDVKSVPVGQHNELQEQAAVWAPHLGRGVSLRSLRTAFYAFVINEGMKAAQE